jgi:hypothetical protein
VISNGSLFDAEKTEFGERFDRQSFEFRHRLAGHPLFDPERLLLLAQAMSQDPKDIYYDAGTVGIGQRWDDVPLCDVPVDVLLHRIETANAVIILRKADKLPEYAALLDACIAEIQELAGRDLRKLMKIRNAIVFINSPNRVTSYHIDRECSVLLQLRGQKSVHVWDREDREVLTHEELERFWTVDNNSATYKPALEGRATVYELRPGEAIHIPVNAPHWVQNGSEVSVSLNINFHYHDAILADVYRANYWLRRFGLDPMPPGRSPALDSVKRTVYGSARALHHASRRLVRRPSQPAHLDASP